jgi:hypothetical protein
LQYGPTGALVKAGVFGDSEWKTARIVLDIPANARTISYGVFFLGGGDTADVWMDNARLRVVGNAVPLTSSSRRLNYVPDDNDRSRIVGIVEKPQNLGLDDADEDGTSCEFLADSGNGSGP